MRSDQACQTEKGLSLDLVGTDEFRRVGTEARRPVETLRLFEQGLPGHGKNRGLTGFLQVLG